MSEQITKTPKDIAKFIRDNDINFFRLLNSDGIVLLAWNAYPKNKETHLKKLDKRLASDIAPDGIYHLQWRDNTRAAIQTIIIIKGNRGELRESYLTPDMVVKRPVTTSPVALPDENVRSYREALADASELALLRSENADLKRQLAELLSEELEDNAPESILDSPMVTLLKDVGLPLLERFFELKEKQVELAAARPAPAPAAKPTYQAPRAVVRPVTTTPQQQQPGQFSPGGSSGGGGGGSAPADGNYTDTNNQGADTSDDVINFVRTATIDDIIAFANTGTDTNSVAGLLDLVQQYRPDVYEEIVRRAQG